MNAFLRELVRSRANRRCEYCLFPELTTWRLPHHIEHIVARQHGGTDTSENLALACDRCNAFKGPNLSAIDPDTSAVVRLFNPRTDAWAEHFEMTNFRIFGRTNVGRATERLLNFNDSNRVEFRSRHATDEPRT